MNDLLDQLKAEHRQVQKILDEMTQSSTDHGRRKELLTQFEREITGHMAGEERIFYPSLEQHKDTKPQALEAEEEHNVAKVVLGQLRETATDNERWLAKANVLKELIDHHIDEEEKELFKSAKKVLSKDDFERMLPEYESERDAKRH